MNHQEFVSEIRKRLKADDKCHLHEIWEPHPQRNNGAPIPTTLLEITLYSYFTREIIRIGCLGQHTYDEIGTQFKIEVCTINIRQEVIPQYNESFYGFSYKTAYDGSFQKNGAPDGAIDFESLFFVLRDQTPLKPYL